MDEKIRIPFGVVHKLRHTLGGGVEEFMIFFLWKICDKEGRGVEKVV